MAAKRGVEVTIYTNPDLNRDDNGKEKRTFKEGIMILKESGAIIKLAGRIHNKTLCVDKTISIEGSFNWLSAIREVNHKWQRHERSRLYRGEGVERLIEDAIDEMEKRVSQSN